MGLFDFLRGGSPSDQLARSVIAEIKRRDPSVRVRYDRRNEMLHAANGANSYLGRLSQEVPETDKAAYAEMVADTAGILLGDMPEEITLSEAKPRLRPAIKNLTHVLNLPANWRGSSQAQAVRPLTGPLGLIVTIDFSRRMVLVTEDQLAEWQIGLDEAIGIATENLRAESPSKFERLVEGFFISGYDDYYDASRILFPELFTALPIKGEPVAIVVSRRGLVVAGSEEPAALAAMARFAEAAADNETRAISYVPIVLRSGSWRPWEVDVATHPEFEPLMIKQRLFDIGVQASELPERLAEQHIDRRVADVFVHEHEGRPYLFSQLKGPCLLPRVDVVCMSGRRGNGIISRRFEDYLAVTGPLEELPNAYPPIYFADQLGGEALEKLIDESESPAGFFEADEGWVNFSPDRRWR